MSTSSCLTARWLSAASWIAAVCAAAVASAVPIDLLPRSARWALTLNLAKLRSGEVGRFATDEMKGPEANEQFAAFKTVYELDPRTDIDTVTFYSADQEGRETVALISGKIDPDRLAARLAKAPGYRAAKVRGRVVHRWVDAATRDEAFGCLCRGGVVAVSGSEQALREMLDAQEGKAPGARESPVFRNALTAGADVFLEAIFVPGAAGPHVFASEVLKQTETGHLALAERGGRAIAQLVLVAASEDVRMRADAALRAILAIAALDEERPAMGRLAQKVTFDAEGRVLKLGLDVPAAEFVALLREQKAEARKHAAGPAAAREIPGPRQ